MRTRKPNRLANYDYSQDNFYFVTSCVKKRLHLFGEVEQGKMIINENGKIAERQWHWLAERYPYVILHAFIVMPNHIHGIIEINRGNIFLEEDENSSSLSCTDRSRTDRSRPVCTLPAKNIPKIKSLSELMGAYKTTVSKKIHLSGNHEFAWHRSFYEHIIRDEKSFRKISEYIEKNPILWENDDYNIL